MRSSTSAILPFCAEAVATVVFSAVKLSLSLLVVARSCATVSFSAFTSSAICSFAIGAAGTGADEITGPNLATPSDPPTAPKLAATATQAASSAKRVLRDCGAGAAAAAAGSGFLSGMTVADAVIFGAAEAFGAWLADSSNFGNSVLVSIFGSAFGSAFASIFSSLGASGSVSAFGISGLGSSFGSIFSSLSGLAGSTLATIGGASVMVRTGSIFDSILGVSSLDMAAFPMERNS